MPLLNEDNVRFLINKSFQKHDLPGEWIKSEVIGKLAEAYIKSQLGGIGNRIEDDVDWRVGGQYAYQLYFLAVEYRAAALLLPLVVLFDENAARKQQFLIETADSIVQLLIDANPPQEAHDE